LKSNPFTFKDQDNIDIFVYKWEPDNGQAKAVIQFSHGVGEHAERYQYVAEYLTGKGYICYANDHRGHGKSIKNGHVGYLGPNGWDGTVNSVHELTKLIRKENPNIPLFFFGHSFGSLLGQDIIQQWGSDYKGAILSGTTGSGNKLLLKVGSFLAKRASKKSPTDPNAKLTEMNFKPFNKRWAKEPNATRFEWLSRDKKQVEKYINDPLCGFDSPASYFVELIKGLNKIWKKSNEKKIPLNLPIYFIAGEYDPVGNSTKFITKLINRYKSYGVHDLQYKFYDEARHEMLNEINKEEVYEDVYKWLESHL
jgi:alpha-beta hydrolase superfamily lysophospholipase